MRQPSIGAARTEAVADLSGAVVDGGRGWLMLDWGEHARVGARCARGRSFLLFRSWWYVFLVAAGG